MLASCATHAEQQCALENTETYISVPKDGRSLPEHGTVQIRKGQRYEVGPLMRGWIGVKQDNDLVWAQASKFSACPAEKMLPVTSNSKSTKKQRKHSSPSSSTSDGGCVCGSGQVCTGPRGGRYCITSGGKKRYGV